MIAETGPTYATYTEPSLPSIPNAGNIITDARFNTRIMKLTDSGDSATGCTLAYSNFRYFNVNSTRVACGIYNSYYRLKIWDFNPATMVRSNGIVMPQTYGGLQFTGTQFSSIDADKMFVARANSSFSGIYSYKPSTQAFTLIKDLTSVVQATGGANSYLFQMTVSTDDNVFAGHIMGGTQAGYLVYRASTDTVLLNRTISAINEVSIDKSGRYLWVVKGSGHSVWDLNAGPTETTVTGLPNGTHHAIGNAANLMCTASGSSLGRRNFSAPNTVITLLGSGVWAYGQQSDHFSATGPDAWAAGSRYHLTAGGVATAFDNEIVLVRTDGSGNVRRLAHHRAVFSSYYDAPFASVSQDGNFAIWSSNWGGGGRYDVYIAEVAAAADTTPPAAPTGVMVV
jgi:hypothetical protein